MTDLVHSFIENQVMHLELKRIDKKNALTTEMYLGMTEVFKRASKDESVKALLFKGGQGCFCAGNDIEDFLNNPALEEDGAIVQFLKTLSSFPKPLVAAVSGPAVGIGTTLLLHCDLVYATDKTLFSLPFVNLGLCPEAASSYLLPRQLGYVKAAELLMLAEPFGAAKAKELGIINEVVAEEKYFEYAQAQAEKLAQKPAQAMLVTKQLLRANYPQVAEVILKEAQHFSPLLETDDAKNIFKKFLGK